MTICIFYHLFRLWNAYLLLGHCGFIWIISRGSKICRIWSLIRIMRGHCGSTWIISWGINVLLLIMWAIIKTTFLQISQVMCWVKVLCLEVFTAKRRVGLTNVSNNLKFLWFLELYMCSLSFNSQECISMRTLSTYSLLKENWGPTNVTPTYI